MIRNTFAECIGIGIEIVSNKDMLCILDNGSIIYRRGF